MEAWRPTRCDHRLHSSRVPAVVLVLVVVVVVVVVVVASVVVVVVVEEEEIAATAEVYRRHWNGGLAAQEIVCCSSYVAQSRGSIRLEEGEMKMTGTNILLIFHTSMILVNKSYG